MVKRHVRNLAAGSGGLLLALAFTGTVAAQSAAQVFQANLTQLNSSGTTGTATVRLEGNQATVNVNATGASPNLAHATHIRVGGTGSCPTNRSTNTRDAQSAIGQVAVSLTTTGDVNPSSALAVDRMPKADGQGRISYSRTFTLPQGVTAAQMNTATISVHGVSKLGGDRNKYDGNAKSELDNKLPAEATAPAACGDLNAAPAGGVATGGGSTAGVEHTALFGIGASALIASGVLTLVYLRRSVLATRKQ